MNEPALASLAQRLHRLERELRWWKRGVFGLAVLAVVALVPSVSFTAAPRVVEATRVVLRDDAGKVRATMQASAGGPFEFTINDANEQRLAQLSQWGLYFFWGSKEARASMFWNGQPLIYITDKDGTLVWKAPQLSSSP
ncbi:MAG TPA: hypothetical protein VID04_07615 [Methylomirabilota bacterium]|jgi:hypothetical protein